MIQNPEYGVEIIVLVKKAGKYSWFISDKTFWVLDYVKWGQIFVDYEFTEVEPIRKDFLVLDQDNWPDFEKTILDLKYSIEQLSDLILRNCPIESWNEMGELFPSLFIDFDQKTLYSMFPELLTFEKYIPEGWVGEFKDFYELIPDTEKYWVINGFDYSPKE